MSYKTLDIYTLSMELFFKIHPLSLRLPSYERYEQGSQIRRSADSIVSNIVEGYGRRMYKAEYIRFLIFAHSSTDETINHIVKLKRLYPHLKEELQPIEDDYNILGAKINRYIQYVKNSWK